jgi:hypothetical protein
MPAIRLSAMRTDLGLAVVSGMLQAATGLKCLKDSKSLTNKLSLDILDESGWCKNVCSQEFSPLDDPCRVTSDLAIHPKHIPSLPAQEVCCKASLACP